MKISVVNLTWNRRELVQKTWEHNVAKAGRPMDEVIWVDNGSADGTAEYALSLKPDTLILNRHNLGVSKGLNQGYALARCDWIFCIGDRTLMPDNWLLIFDAILGTDQVDALVLQEVPIEQHPERRMPGDDVELAGYRCRPSIAYGSRVFRRSLLSTVGYHFEGFGLYGWDDVEWCHRCTARKIRCYMLPDHLAPRQPDIEWKREDGQDYREWRNQQAQDASKIAIMNQRMAEGWPYFNPFA